MAYPIQSITQRELRNDSGKIMSALDAGKSFVVTRNGTPVGELRPIRRTTFVPAALVLTAFAGIAEVSLDELRRDLDAVADQTIEPQT